MLASDIDVIRRLASAYNNRHHIFWSLIVRWKSLKLVMKWRCVHRLHPLLWNRGATMNWVMICMEASACAWTVCFSSPAMVTSRLIIGIYVLWSVECIVVQYQFQYPVQFCYPVQQGDGRLTGTRVLEYWLSYSGMLPIHDKYYSGHIVYLVHRIYCRYSRAQVHSTPVYNVLNTTVTYIISSSRKSIFLEENRQLDVVIQR